MFSLSPPSVAPYAPVAGIYDEMLTPGQILRPHWHRLAEGLDMLGSGEISRRWDRGQRLLRANGVTYTVYGAPEGVERQWQLDPFPLLVQESEWAAIERALVQRAHLLNAILDDLYGEQTLLRRRLLPPGLVHANPAFLRALVGMPSGGPRLHFYAADLARSPDGLWWVAGDRAEAPSGAGYALENRSVLSRMLPESYSECNVRRLAPWFLRARRSLAERAPQNKDEPRIVLLTPGIYNETWFEHAYLARILGLTLAEGEDLTVRDGRVHLKTTEGLRPVDVVLRRTDGAFCDPLELRHDSTLGVPGLVEAVSRQRVVLCNALGSGVVESPAMMAFLPGLSRLLLGEELLMPSVATWWCGQKAERDYVIANLERLALRPAFSVSAPLVRGAELSAGQRQQWIDRLRAAPEDWVAQEAVDLSTAPTWQNQQIVPRPVVMRVHACAVDRSYDIMPGGLTRTGASPRELSVSMQQGGGSKDTWVLCSEPEPVAPILTEPEPGRLLRGSTDLPSRVADNMFWMGRYLERAEDLCRLLRAVLGRTMQGSEAASETTAALSVFQRLGHLPWSLNVADSYNHTRMVRDVVRLNLSGGTPWGLAAVLASIQRVTSVARDRLSMDTWRTVGSLSGHLRQLDSHSSSEAADLFDIAGGIDELMTTLSALSGLAQESMTRGLGWRFMDIGRRIERALHCLDMLDNTRTSRSGTLLAALEIALDVTDNQMTYRARYPALPRFVPVLDLLLADETSPRSLAFQIARLGRHMDVLAPDPVHRVFTPEQKTVISLQATIRTLSLEEIAPAQDVSSGGQKTLASLTDSLRGQILHLVDTLARRFFVHAAEQRQPHHTALRQSGGENA